MFSFFKRRAPLYISAITLFLGGLLGHYYCQYFQNAPNTAIQTPHEPNPGLENTCELVATRTKGYELIQPLMYAELSCESPIFGGLKIALDKQIGALKMSGNLTNASIYLREFSHGEWMDLNGEEVYHPASLIKVPIMMAILKMAEKNPGLLEKEIVFDNIPKEMLFSKQNYVSDTIAHNKKYTVRELLRYMVSCSDNNAQLLLIKNLDPSGFDQMFSDLGLGMPMDESSKQILLTVKGYSAFIKTLFNATYLDPSKSEFALSLMQGSKFMDGFMQGLPANTKVAHKFGEWDDKKTFELHESGLIYIKNKVFLITIMTRSDSRDKLPSALSALTRTIYDQLTKES